MNPPYHKRFIKGYAPLRGTVIVYHTSPEVSRINSIIRRKNVSKREMISAIRRWMKNADYRTVCLIYNFALGACKVSARESE